MVDMLSSTTPWRGRGTSTGALQAHSSVHPGSPPSGGARVFSPTTTARPRATAIHALFLTPDRSRGGTARCHGCLPPAVAAMSPGVPAGPGLLLPPPTPAAVTAPGPPATSRLPRAVTGPVCSPALPPPAPPHPAVRTRTPPSPPPQACRRGPRAPPPPTTRRAARQLIGQRGGRSGARRGGEAGSRPELPGSLAPSPLRLRARAPAVRRWCERRACWRRPAPPPPPRRVT